MTNSEKSAFSRLNFRSLSIRTKILTAYGLLILLFFAILLTGFSQFKSIATKLNLVQFVYLPLGNKISSLSSLYHLDSDFNFDALEANYKNPLFINAVSQLNPAIFDQTLKKAIADANQAITAHRLNPTLAPLQRLHQITDQLISHHEDYVSIITQAVAELRAAPKNIKKIEASRTAILEKKRNVKSHLAFLSGRVQDLTKKSIQDIVHNERRAVFVIAGLSLITFFIAIIIGLISIASLVPLRKLQEAAKEIAEGHLEIRAPVHTNDEVGKLAKEFNTMADSILQRDQALRVQQKQLIESQKMAVIGQMASKISHEIRNPLNALSLNVELLDEKVTDQASKSLITSIAKEIDRLNRITVQYLDMARTPKGSMQEISLQPIFDHLKNLLAQECQTQGIQVSFEIEPNLPMLKSNTTHLEQALLNLCRNAMEAVGPQGTWGLRAFQKSDCIVISVWDRGPGIAQETLNLIFEPFFTTKDKGTGLGLAITNEICKELHIGLSCESTLGKGTTFLMSIPRTT